MKDLQLPPDALSEGAVRQENERMLYNNSPTLSAGTRSLLAQEMNNNGLAYGQNFCRLQGMIGEKEPCQSARGVS